MKIAIVGAEESKWNKTQKAWAQYHIINILVNPCVISYKGESEGYCRTDFDPRRVTLISGHCPKGGVDIWAEEIADFYKINKEIYKPDVNQWDDIRGRSEDWEFGKPRHPIIKKGYRSRNIQIAKACDVLYCIVPKVKLSAMLIDTKLTRDNMCIHCEKARHSTNGGCWTMKYARKLGKETHLIVI